MNITFIGLGTMGTAMAERLLAAKYTVTVFNRTPEKTKPLLALGATVADSIDSAVANADVVMSCLLDDAAVLDVTATMLKKLKPGKIHVCLATILPETAEKLLALHQASHTHYISATVLGVPLVARAGELTCFCAGDMRALETAMPLLATFSNNIMPLGDNTKIKSPNLMKICMNYSLITAIELISELYVFSEKSGLDKELVQKGLHHIYGHPAFKRYIDKIADRDFDRINFNMAGGNKDAGIFQQAFNNVGVEPALGNILKSRFEKGLASGMSDKDWSGIYEVIRKDAGLP